MALVAKALEDLEEYLEMRWSGRGEAPVPRRFLHREGASRYLGRGKNYIDKLVNRGRIRSVDGIVINGSWIDHRSLRELNQSGTHRRRGVRHEDRKNTKKTISDRLQITLRQYLNSRSKTDRNKANRKPLDPLCTAPSLRGVVEWLKRKEEESSKHFCHHTHKQPVDALSLLECFTGGLDEGYEAFAP